MFTLFKAFGTACSAFNSALNITFWDKILAWLCFMGTLVVVIKLNLIDFSWWANFLIQRIQNQNNVQ